MAKNHSRFSGEAADERKILDSWKDIADYLNRSVKTCHRWEEELGLPIHRLDGTPRARVFAYPAELDRWLAEKLRVAEAPRTERRKWTKWIWITAGAVLAVAALAGLGWKFFLEKPIPVPAQVPTLAVLPFENKTGDSTWDAWKKALPDLITIDLWQSKFLDVIRTSYLFQAVGSLAEAEKFSPEDLKKVAEKAEVDYAVTGSLNKSGDEVIINALVQNARTGEVVASPRATFRNEKDIFSGVDRLSKAVKAGFNITPRQIRGDIDKPVARITTSSPQAFKLYSQAYRVQGKQKFDEAISPILKAVEIDPKFGLAYRGLFLYCWNVSRKEESKKYGEMAIRLADRIAVREREYFLDTFYSFEQLHIKRIDALKRLEKNYPYDTRTGSLSDIYAFKEEWDKAIPILERLILRFPKRYWVNEALSACYQSVGLYDKAEKLLDDCMKANPKLVSQTVTILENRARLALVQSKFDEAHDCADRLATAFPNLSSGLRFKGFVYFWQDDFANAEKKYQEVAEKDDKLTQRSGYQSLAAVSLSRGRIEEAKQRILRAIELDKMDKSPGQSLMEGDDHRFLAYLERLSGRLPEALKEADLACRGSEKRGIGSVRALYLRALIALEMNRFEEFEKQAEEIKKLLGPDGDPNSFPRLMRIYYNLLGHRELQKANYDLAIRYYWKALDLLSVLGASSVDEDHAKYYYDLAEAYRRRYGGLPLDISMYEKAVLPTVRGKFSGDLYAKSFYWMGLYWERTIRNLGTPAEAQERRLKTIGYYRKFLDLWKDADPIFPEVEDAKKRLARLEAE